MLDQAIRHGLVEQAQEQAAQKQAQELGAQRRCQRDADELEHTFAGLQKQLNQLDKQLEQQAETKTRICGLCLSP